ncbi:peptidyl-prolyl cis-trans isomerase [Nocardioides daeguensis]|uniref:PpiC domain-containing protein n=1 Tax=Nocardioides daeguensis TaxID=908359 RepID=A0ABP6UY17_9ACTN|nr:peptidylprolyl isomerase [Nocardioides daeguensis]MBV6728782.1 peptidylprolyl isomerase [Nocardioides daeguensis]MCR1773608.1 peptidylprolyl isomerase [Nocardioides daeguensis]
MIVVRELLSAPWRRMVAALVAVLVVSGGAVLVHHRLTALPDDAVLRYGDRVVTEADLEKHVDTLNALYGVAEPERRDAQDGFKRDVAKSMAVALILDRAAKDEDIVISERSARDTLASMLETQLGPDPRKAFQDLLTEFGVSEGDILEEIRRQQAIARLFKAVTQDAVDEVTAEEAKALYDEDPSAFEVPEKRKIANIVVATRDEAQALVASIHEGTSFSSLARARSLDDATRDKGGVLGTVGATELDETYAAAAFAAGEGDTFGPVQTAYGWNVGRVLAVVAARPRAYQAVAADALDAVRSERAMRTWRSWLADRIKGAEIEYADAYLPAHPDEPPTEASPARAVE